MEGIKTSLIGVTGNESNPLDDEQAARQKRLEAIEQKLDEYYAEQDEAFDRWRLDNGTEYN